jgi:hypothetical protein
MFLQRSNGTVLGTVFLYSFWGSEILLLAFSSWPLAKAL